MRTSGKTNNTPGWPNLHRTGSGRDEHINTAAKASSRSLSLHPPARWGALLMSLDRRALMPQRWIFFTFPLYCGSFAELGSGCAWSLPRGGCFSQVISESRYYRCHTSVCSSILCLVTTKIWSDGHYSPLGVSQLSGLG